MTPEQGVLEAFREVMAELHPGYDWLPAELAGSEPAPAEARQIVGSLAAPEDDRPLDEARSNALDKLNEITRAGFGDWYIGLAEMDAIETAMLALDALEPAPPTLKGEDE